MNTCQPGRASLPDSAVAVSGHQIALVQGLSKPETLSSAVVLRGHKSVSIEHEGVIYRLQVTKLGKLILTK